MATEQRRGYKSRQHALTLTFRDLTGYRRGMVTLATCIRNYDFVDYVFYPEFTHNGNIHFHGMIWEKNRRNYNGFLSTWNYFYGFTKESRLTDQVKWHLYCRKEQHEFFPSKIKRIHRYNSLYISERMIQLRFP